MVMGPGTDVTIPLCGMKFGDVIVVTGLETGADAIIVAVGGAGRVSASTGDGFENCGGGWVNFVSDTFGFVVVELLVAIDVVGNGEGGDDFVGDSKVTQGSRFFICSDK